MFYEFLKVLLGITFAGIGIAMVRAIRVTDKERKQILFRANSAAHGAWSAVRMEEKRQYNVRIKEMKAELAMKDARIAELEAEVARWDAIGKAVITGKGGNINARCRQGATD